MPGRRRYWDGIAWTDHYAEDMATPDPSSPAGPPAEPSFSAPALTSTPPAGPINEPVDADSETKGRKLVVAGLVTSAGSLLLCPILGSLAGGGLTLAGQRTTPPSRRPSLKRLPLIAYVLSALGVVGWTTAMAVGAVGTEDKKVPDDKPITTTIMAPSTTAAATASTFPVPTGDDQLLSALRIAPENDPGGYNRSVFAYPEGGMDDRGCDARKRVLQRDSTVPAQVTYPGCNVLTGRWVDSYTGVTYEKPSEVSIDHLVALKQASLDDLCLSQVSRGWPALE